MSATLNCPECGRIYWWKWCDPTISGDVDVDESFHNFWAQVAIAALFRWIEQHDTIGHLVDTINRPDPWECEL